MILNNQTVALFIDADNASASKIEFIISELAIYGSVMIRRIYGNWKNENLISWEKVLLEHAIQPVQQFDYTKGKNATDMSLTIDVMDYLYSNKVDVFCIVSSDCDFTPLAMRIKTEGKQVIGFGEKKTPVALVKACSKFIFLENEDKNTQPKKKRSKELKCDTSLMNVLRDAVLNSADESGWANLSLVGKVISNQTSFDSRNYGYSKLSSLIQAIDLFEIKFSNEVNNWLVRDKRRQ